jgi:hypothetical protein
VTENLLLAFGLTLFAGLATGFAAFLRSLYHIPKRNFYRNTWILHRCHDLPGRIIACCKEV